MAHEIPLILFDCEFENTNWFTDEESVKALIISLQEQWSFLSIK